MKFGDTGLELGDSVKEEEEVFGEPEGEVEAAPEELTEEEAELASEFGEATKEDFIRAIKNLRDQNKKSNEKADLYKDLYHNIPDPVVQRQRPQRQQNDQEDEFAELAKKGDLVEVVGDALEQERMIRRNEFIRNETLNFVKTHPDFYERLEIVDRLASTNRKYQISLENHPRPWELVYELAEKVGGYVPKGTEIKGGSQVEQLKKIKENANKVKPMSSLNSKTVVKKSIKDMSDDEFEKHYAEVRGRE